MTVHPFPNTLFLKVSISSHNTHKGKIYLRCRPLRKNQWTSLGRGLILIGPHKMIYIFVEEV
jgi:hypothetical protein